MNKTNIIKIVALAVIVLAAGYFAYIVFFPGSETDQQKGAAVTGDLVKNEKIHVPPEYESSTEPLAPAIAIASPSHGSAAEGVVAAAADITPQEGAAIKRVEWYVNDELRETNSGSPYEASLETRILKNGVATIGIKAYDAKERMREKRIAVIVGNKPTIANFTVRPFSYLDGGDPAHEIEEGERIALAWRVLSSEECVGAGGWQGSRSDQGTLTSVLYRTADFTLSCKNALGTAMRTVTIPVLAVPPKISFLSPLAGATLKNIITIRADAEDNSKVNRVEFFIDGLPLATLKTKPYELFFDTRQLEDGTHEIRGQVFDEGGNTAERAMSVTLRNN